MQVTAISTPTRPEWRWRIVNYAGEVIEESSEFYPTISAAVAQGSARMLKMDVVDRSQPLRVGRTTSYLRSR